MEKITIWTDCLQDCIPPEMIQQKKQCFLDGYRTEFEISEDMMLIIPACRRFANLYGYVRVLRSVEENGTMSQNG